VFLDGQPTNCIADELFRYGKRQAFITDRRNANSDYTSCLTCVLRCSDRPRKLVLGVMITPAN
jgi:hypothetical protein